MSFESIRKKILEIVESSAAEDKIVEKLQELVTELDSFIHAVLLEKVKRTIEEKNLKLSKAREFEFELAGMRVVLEIRRGEFGHPRVSICANVPSDVRNKYYSAGIQDQRILNYIAGIEKNLLLIENLKKLDEILSRILESTKKKVDILKKTFNELRSKAAKYLVANKI